VGQSSLHIRPRLILLLEELLIDFRELQGEHSGENMAEAVWETLKQYGLIGQVSLAEYHTSTGDEIYLSKVIAFVMDNATNNDMLMAAIERRCDEARVYFSAMESQMRCMPHTVHLATIKVCPVFQLCVCQE